MRSGGARSARELTMTNRRTILHSLATVAVVLSCTLPLRAAKRVVIVQTNSAGDNVHLIDPATNKIVGTIDGIEANHGAAIAPDGTRIYISNEAMSTLDVVDAKTLKVTKQVPLSGHPNNLAVGRDGKRVYVGIIQAPGGVDVIDTATMQRLKTLPTKGSIHNPYVTPDGKYVVAGSIAGKSINVFDTATDQPAWTLDMDLGVRPMTFSANPDGSTKWLFVQLTDLNGFAVIDFATHKELKRVDNPALPPGHSTVPQGADPSHGMAVTADNKTLVVCSRLNNALYSYSLPDLNVSGTAFLGGKGAAWVTLTPDGKKAYVSNAVTNDVSVIDVPTMKEVVRIPVGYVPKRNTTGVLAQ
jgi:YVTN family beta-propeller protein